MQSEGRMGADRDLFSRAAGAHGAELKAHAALYAAREAGAAATPPAASLDVTARPRPVPQGGAAVARRMREKLVAEREQLKAVSLSARANTSGSVPSASILRFRLSDLPGLAKATPRRRAEDADGGPGRPNDRRR